MQTSSTNGKQELSQSVASEGASTRFILLAIAVVTLVFFLPIKRSWTISVDAAYTHVFVNYGVEDGEAWARPLAALLLLGFGALATTWPGGKPLNVDNLLIVPWIGLVAWCAMSCLWATDTGYAAKRVVGDLAGIIAAYGICKRVSAYQFVWIVFGVTSTWVGLGLLAEFSQATFRPWETDHRFAGIFHPNGTGWVCVLSVLSAVYLARYEPQYRKQLIAVALVAFVCLYLTRSRTSLISLLLALGIGWVYITPRHRMVFGMALGAPLAAVAALLMSGNVVDKAASMGRETSEVSSLTNRLPLWQELVPFIAEQPWSGYGYGFWLEDHDLYEPAQSAHSMYVDAVLAFGFIGAALYVAGILLVLVWNARYAAYETGYGFLALFVVIFIVSGFSETSLGFADFSGFLLFCAVSFVALCAGPEVSAMAPARERTPQAVVSGLQVSLRAK